MRYKKGTNGQIEYPVNQVMINDLINSPIDVVSVIGSTSSRLSIDMDDIPEPSHIDDVDSDLWNELVDVSKLVFMAKNDVKIGKTGDVIQRESIKTILNDPNLEKPFCSRTMIEYYGVDTYRKGAMLVRDDYPLHILVSLAEFLLKRGAKFRKILPDVGFQRFTDSMVLSSHVIGWAVHTVSPNAFACKWKHGRARPEEVIHGWLNGDFPNIDPNIEKQLNMFINNKDEIKNDQNKFTLYSEGCPNHPSYPAMHGAAAGAGLLFPILFDLTLEEEEEVRRTVLNIAMFRNVAGVHYESDSLMGIQIGEMVLAEKLPEFLEGYGAIKSDIEQLILDKKRTWI